MPKPSNSPAIDLGKTAVRQGVAATTFRVSREQGLKIKELERTAGSGATLQFILQLMRQRVPAKTMAAVTAAANALKE